MIAEDALRRIGEPHKGAPGHGCDYDCAPCAALARVRDEIQTLEAVADAAQHEADGTGHITDLIAALASLDAARSGRTTTP